MPATDRNDAPIFEMDFFQGFALYVGFEESHLRAFLSVNCGDLTKKYKFLNT